MVEPYISTPVIAEKASSPLGASHEPGRFGDLKGGIGVSLSERSCLAIADIAAWPGEAAKTIAAINSATGLSLAAATDCATEHAQAFEYAPRRWTVIVQDPDMPSKISAAIGDAGTVVDLSHGRTVFSVSGPQVEWVLAKLFAVNLSHAAFPTAKGLATKHHEIAAHIQRVDATRFDVVVFRSYARAFWHSLTKAAEEVGYEVV